jgi:NAD(P)-dependent dehydrogenase (short-subunit alcohol dehydrogenase family)
VTGVALVTGAAHERGIGRGIALVLAEAGWDVAVADVQYEDQAAERVREIEALGRRAAFVRADVARPEECERMVAEAVDRLGRLDCFVSNAGVAVWKRIEDVTQQDWDVVTGVNIHGCLYGCRAAIAQMRRQGGGGRVVITSSVHAVMPFEAMSTYGLTKQAVGHLAGVLALECAEDGITVNHVGPGWVRSAINDPNPGLQTDAGLAEVLASIPLHRPAKPREIGHAVAYLASHEAAYTTGAYVRVDGAFTAGKY